MKELDNFYDEIEEINTLIEEVETRLYNIKQEKISGDNVYQFSLFFDKLYDRFTDIEEKTFMKSFLGRLRQREQAGKQGCNRKTHCIKDRVLLDDTCGGEDFLQG